MAKTRGEISVVARAGSVPPRPSGCRPTAGRARPTTRRSRATAATWRSSRRPATSTSPSATARWACGCATVRTGRTVALARGASRAPFSAYNPSLSGDGRRVAFETSDSATGALAVWVADPQTGRSQAIARPTGVTSDLYEPALSRRRPLPGVHRRDGRSSCATWRPARRAKSRRRRRVGPGRQRAAARASRSRAGPGWSSGRGERRRARSRPGGRRDVGVGAVAVGRRVARGLHRARRGRARHRRLRPRPADGGDNARLARARGCPGRPRSAPPRIRRFRRRHAGRVHLRRLEPLAAQVQPGARIFVRDLTTATTTLVSTGDGLNRGIGPTKGSGGESAMRIALLCASVRTPSSSSET